MTKFYRPVKGKIAIDLRVYREGREPMTAVSIMGPERANWSAISGQGDLLSGAVNLLYDWKRNIGNPAMPILARFHLDSRRELYDGDTPENCRKFLEIYARSLSTAIEFKGFDF